LPAVDNRIESIVKPMKYEPTLPGLIDLMRKTNMPLSMIKYNLKRYGMEKDIPYVLEQLGFERKSTKPKPEKQKLTPVLSLSGQAVTNAKFFAFAFDTEDECFVRLYNKQMKESRFYSVSILHDPLKLSAILKSHRFEGNTDIMYSLATYRTMKSAKDENIFSMHLVAIDVDFRKVKRFKNVKPLDVWKEILSKEVGKTIPHPSAVEYGHQLRLLYKFETVYATQKSKSLVSRLSSVFAERLKDYGADKQPVSSNGRVIGSRNSKDGSEIKIKTFESHIYTLKELQKWLDPTPDWYPVWKTKPKKAKIIHLQNEYNLNLTRLEDFKRIQEYFDYDCDGFKRFLCFQFRNHAILAGYSPTEARDMMLEFNSRFQKPLKPNVIEQDTRYLNHHQYYYRNETILDFIGITPEIEKEMGLKTVISETEKKRRHVKNERERYHANKEEINTKRREKYREKNGISKKEKIAELKAKIKSLKEQGFKNETIAEELLIPMKTLKRHITDMRKEGLLP
jgi:hypothetical protein